MVNETFTDYEKVNLLSVSGQHFPSEISLGKDPWIH